jgi:hypothetical protein
MLAPACRSIGLHVLQKAEVALAIRVQVGARVMNKLKHAEDCSLKQRQTSVAIT